MVNGNYFFLGEDLVEVAFLVVVLLEAVF